MSKPNCIRCGKDFTQDVPQVAYCPNCVAEIRGALDVAASKQHSKRGNVSNFAEGSFVSQKDMPKSFLSKGQMCCGLCGSSRLYDDYGHSACGFGTSKTCLDCKAVLDFQPDTGE